MSATCWSCWEGSEQIWSTTFNFEFFFLFIFFCYQYPATSNRERSLFLKFCLCFLWINREVRPNRQLPKAPVHQTSKAMQRTALWYTVAVRLLLVQQEDILQFSMLGPHSLPVHKRFARNGRSFDLLMWDYGLVCVFLCTLITNRREMVSDCALVESVSEHHWVQTRIGTYY